MARIIQLISNKPFTGFLLFLLGLLWFYFPGEYVQIANRDLSLFLPTPEYLLSFLDRPGGLLEYLGSFLSQFYRIRLAGAMVLGLVLATVYLASQKLFARISGKNTPQAVGIISTLLVLGMHNFYPHQLSHSLGLILTLALAAHLPSRSSKRRMYLVLAVPLIYLVTGGFVWLFSGLVLMGILVGNGKADVPSLLLCLLYPGLIIALGASFVFLYPWKDLATARLPFGPTYGPSPWPIFFMAWVFLVILLLRFPFWGKKLPRLGRAGLEIAFSLLACLLILHFSFNRKNAELFTIEKLAIQEDWESLLAYTEEHPSTNLFGSFYTNLALAHEGLLLKDLFKYPQGFGRRGLCFEWEEKSEILRRGSDFFWAILFVNEAHHWAFESWIIDGPTRRNLQRLIQTELVRGNDKIAGKYIDHLGTALFQGKLAKKYAAFLYRPEAILEDPELGPRFHVGMPKDFFAEGADLEKNLRSVLANHPFNPLALDYLMALYLLEKQVDKIPALLPDYQKVHRGTLPTLLEESLLVYQITHREHPIPDLQISPATLQRFEAYTQVLRQYRNPKEAARMLYPDYKNTFWFHLNFNNLATR